MDKNPIAAMLVGKMGAAKPEDDSGDEDGASMCAQHIIDAVHAKDHKALVQALKDFSVYNDEGGSESDEPGDAGAAAKDPNAGFSAHYKG